MQSKEMEKMILSLICKKFLTDTIILIHDKKEFITIEPIFWCHRFSSYLAPSSLTKVLSKFNLSKKQSIVANCTYCGSSRKIHQDHIIAKSKGGVKTTPACANCNWSKGNKPLMEWIRYLKKNNPYRYKRIINHNKGKRSNIAKKIQKIRDE